MNIEFDCCCLSIAPELYLQLNKAIKNKKIDIDTNQITVNFRDSSYSVSAGGYHPVEISFQKNVSNGKWSLLYITDFCYYGNQYPELIKEVDFNFSSHTFYLVNASPMFLARSTVKNFYKFWESNFLAYLECNAFDEIEVNAY